MSHRTQVTLTDAQYERLRAESERTGLSMAELVRRAIDAAYVDDDVERRLADLRASAGVWADRDDIGDSLEYRNSLWPGMGQRTEQLWGDR